MAMLYGDLNKADPYLVMMKWNPGWFSAPREIQNPEACTSNCVWTEARARRMV
jgi:hypothetical protein